jgi:diguanylate cyclase (GGDEF)-like protein
MKFIIFALTLILSAATGIADHYTAREMSLSIFYLIPISLSAWYCGLSAAVFTAIFSVSAFYIADFASTGYTASTVILIWSMAVRCALYAIVIFFVLKTKYLLKKEREISRIDHLTGVSNSRAFYETVHIENERAGRHGRDLSLAYLDIDDFKKVNDTLGHHAGDTLLREIAQTIKKSIRAADMVARIGGDEFVIMLTETGREEAYAATGKVRENLMEEVNIHGWPVSFSIGVVSCRPPVCSVDDLILEADRTMYSVKQSGKNNIAFKFLVKES